MTYRHIFPFALVLLLHPLVPPASGQSVEGDVVDETGAAVRSVIVGLIDEDGRLVGHGRSDAAGHFTVEAPAPGRYRVHAAGVGYRSLTGGPYDLVGDVVLELFVVIHRAPIALEGVDVKVEGRVPRLASNGFYDRAADGWGHFFEGDEVRRSGSAYVAEFLARLPGVHADQPGAKLFGPGSVRNPALVLEHAGGSCVPALWVNGSLVRSGGSAAESLRPDDWVDTEELAGVELYTSAAGVPIEFSHSAACGVLVVWSRAS